MKSRPGLAKVRSLPLLTATTATRVQAADAPWAELLESADIMSEGGIVPPTGTLSAPTWFGTTSIIIRTKGCSPRLARAVAEMSPHMHLRAVRIACAEAGARAPSPIDTARCDLRIESHAHGVRIDVDLEAPLRAKASSDRKG